MMINAVNKLVSFTTNRDARKIRYNDRLHNTIKQLIVAGQSIGTDYNVFRGVSLE
jgi:hypothetical protein